MTTLFNCAGCTFTVAEGGSDPATLPADEAFELGMGAGTEGPVLSFMLALGAPLLLCSLLCWALLLRGEREWRCTPPWSWIQRASLVHLVGALLLGAIQMVLA